MLNKVVKTIEKYNMLQKSERVLVGLSGGADSVSLLLCLKRLGYNVTASHINHQLRGDESVRDEQFCIELCSKLGVEIFVHRIDVDKYCHQKGLSIEEGARKLRYSIFDKIECDKIATAHTLSDCLETSLFNFARGTGLKGLCSIPPVRNNIVRPLIECTRQEIENFLKNENTGFVTDSTNLQNDYSRNKLRHLVIPVLEDINPSLLSTYYKTLENLKSDEQYLDLQTDKLLCDALSDTGYKAEMLNNAHDSVKNRAIAKILSQNGLRYSYDRIIEISNILKNEGKINLQRNVYAVCKDGRFYIENTPETKTIQLISIQIDFNKQYDFGGKKINFEIIGICDSNENVHKKFANICCDYDKIIGKTFLRNRRNGDKITLCNRSFESSVKKLFNSTVPLSMRDKTAILEDDNGIFFIEGFGCADRVKIDQNTKHILICKIS